MLIQQGISSIRALEQPEKIERSRQESIEQPAGNPENDYAAKLTITGSSRGQLREFNQALSNLKDTISSIQTSDGGFQKTQSVLLRMKRLSMQTAGTADDQAGSSRVQQEIAQLNNEVSRIANSLRLENMEEQQGAFASEEGRKREWEQFNNDRILAEANRSMMAQANQSAQSVMALLQ